MDLVLGLLSLAFDGDAAKGDGLADMAAGDAVGSIQIGDGAGRATRRTR